MPHIAKSVTEAIVPRLSQNVWKVAETECDGFKWTFSAGFDKLRPADWPVTPQPGGKVWRPNHRPEPRKPVDPSLPVPVAPPVPVKPKPSEPTGRPNCVPNPLPGRQLLQGRVERAATSPSSPPNRLSMGGKGGMDARALMSASKKKDEWGDPVYEEDPADLIENHIIGETPREKPSKADDFMKEVEDSVKERQVDP